MKKVLMVEDDQKHTIAMSVRLKAMGYDVATAVDAVSAVAAARRHHPDMLLIDINLPGTDAFVLAERLKLLVQTARIPFIFVTASTEPGLRERAMEVGAVAFLQQPFDASDLVGAIEGSYYMEASG